jgi:hypothetical protein
MVFQDHKAPSSVRRQGLIYMSIGAAVLLVLQQQPHGHGIMMVQANQGSSLECSSITDAPCATSLFDVVQSYVNMMPTEASEKYVHPSQDVMEEWEMIVSDMLIGECNNTPLPDVLADAGYEWGIVSDVVDYCVLASLQDLDDDGFVDFPWGIAVVHMDHNAAGVKNLSIDIPHPLHDSYTWTQGIQVFLGINARSFTMSGSHRTANAEASSCQDKYQMADGAHNTMNTFMASSLAIFEYYANLPQIDTDYTAIQFHGMSNDSCEDDVYLTPGTGLYHPSSREKVVLLRDALLTALAAADVDPRSPDPLLPISVPGETDCNMSGGTNVQGRMLNYVAVMQDKVCTVAAHQYSGTFLHIEQQWDMRQDKLVPFWTDALNAAYAEFETADPPTRITVTSPNDGAEVWGRGTSQTITWTTTGNVPTDDGQHVKISLHRNNDEKTYLRTLVDATPIETGSYVLEELSGYAEEGNDFVVRVRSVSNTNYKDYSDHPLSVVNPITITTPAGGELFQPTDKIEITWNVMDFPSDGQVKLSLHRGQRYWKTIQASINNKPGTFTWTIPSWVQTDHAYSVRVRLVSETSVHTFTPLFCIGSCDPNDVEA